MNKKYLYNTPENRAFLKDLGDELIAFGKRFPSPGGASYYLGSDGTPMAERPRETWITSRMVHVYSIASMFGGGPLSAEECGKLADAGICGLEGELKDQQNGGWYAGRTADGEIIELKQCYTHAFVMLAASSALLAGREGAAELLDEALKVYDRYFWSEATGLARDTWSTSFERCSTYRGLNANMHSVEAFLAVADATGDSKYRERAGRIIDHVISWAKTYSWRLPEHFKLSGIEEEFQSAKEVLGNASAEEWIPDTECNKDKPDDPFKPYGATPGHGIEWARLITQWALGVPEEKRSHYIDAAEKLYDRAIEDGWNADGARGIVYTTDWSGKPVVHDRMHWTLAEAINTSSVLFRVTGKDRYASDYADFMEYLDDTVHDKENGSWLHQLDAGNRLLETVWPGKSDLYHAFQATVIPYEAPELSIALAIARSKGQEAGSEELSVTALGELLIDFTEGGLSDQGNPVLEANPGGAPGNVLAMLGKLGYRSAFIGKVGKDAFGDFLVETAKTTGILTSGIVRDDNVPTTLAFVHTAPDGDRSFSFYRDPGADMMLDESDVDTTLIDRAQVFHFGTVSMTNAGNERATKKAVSYAKAAEKLISFDPNYRPLLWDAPEHARTAMRYGISNCDILKISDDEVLFLTGKETVEEGIDELLSEYKTIGLILVTLGKEGSIGISGGKRVSAKPFIMENTIETTGAGDTFMACMIAFCLERLERTGRAELFNIPEDELLRGLEFANAAAALITTKRGAMKSMPEKAEVERLCLFHPQV